MLDREKIIHLFHKLNDACKEKNIVGEIGVVGGAAMCLAFRARPSTKDVDAVFEPSSEIREAAKLVAKDQGLDSDWLNDAVKGFMVDSFEREDFLNLSHLRVWIPEPRYLLAMKCISARWDTSDRDDVLLLVKELNLKTAREVFRVIETYYPKKQIPPKTQFFIEELFESRT